MEFSRQEYWSGLPFPPSGDLLDAGIGLTSPVSLASAGERTRLVRTFGGSDNNCLAYGGIQGIVIASAMHGCHTCDEYTTVQELTDVAAITAVLLCEA